MVEPDDRCLLVMYKPDGLRRECSPAEVERINNAWRSVLDWLRDSDPDELPYADLVGEVARKAGLRTVRYPEYDIRTWAAQASTLRSATGQRDRATTTTSQFVTVFGKILADIGLARRSSRRCSLTTEAIDLLYAAAPSFQRNRSVVTPRLLDGPVQIERWDGERAELALAAKLLVRRALSATGMTNLVHMDIAPPQHVDQVIRALESTTARRPP